MAKSLFASSQANSLFASSQANSLFASSQANSLFRLRRTKRKMSLSSLKGYRGMAGERGVDGAADVGVEFGGGRAGVDEADAGFVGFLFARLVGGGAGFAFEAAGFFEGFRGFAAFLRFKANFVAALFFSYGSEFVQGSVIGAFVGGLIADEEAEGFVVEFGLEEEIVL